MRQSTYKPSAERMARELADTDGWGAAIAQVDAHKTAPDREVVEWVFNQGRIKATDVDVENAPSRGAVTMLKWVNESSLNYQSFLTNIWAKLLPTKAQLEHQSRFQDDGREQLELLAAFEEEFRASSA